MLTCLINLTNIPNQQGFNLNTRANERNIQIWNIQMSNIDRSVEYFPQLFFFLL